MENDEPINEIVEKEPSYVIFNGIKSSEIKYANLIVQFIPSYEFPEKDYQTMSIPGRNGEFVIDKGTYRNVERTYSFAHVFQENSDAYFRNAAKEIIQWLTSAKGYARLEDSYESEYYRMAMYKAGGNLNNFYDMATAIDVTFECKPERWLKSGEQPLRSAGDITPIIFFENPTGYSAKPILVVYPHPDPSEEDPTKTSEVTIYFDMNKDTTYSIHIDPITFESMEYASHYRVVIDCENKECYLEVNDPDYEIDTDIIWKTKFSCNSKVMFTSGKFPEIPGYAFGTITYDNAYDDTFLIPRWWTL